MLNLTYVSRILQPLQPLHSVTRCLHKLYLLLFVSVDTSMYHVKIIICKLIIECDPWLFMVEKILFYHIAVHFVLFRAWSYWKPKTGWTQLALLHFQMNQDPSCQENSLSKLQVFNFCYFRYIICFRYLIPPFLFLWIKFIDWMNCSFQWRNLLLEFLRWIRILLISVL